MNSTTTQTDYHQPPPANLDAEMWVVGSVLLDPSQIAKCRLDPEDFADLGYRAIWKAIADLQAEGKPVDAHLLWHRLRGEHGLTPAGIGELFRSMPTAIHCPYYSHIVAESSARRWMWRVGQYLAQSSHDQDDILRVAEQATSGLHKHVTERMEGRQ